MAKYLVHATVLVAVTVEVEADSEDEAEGLGYDEIYDCNFDPYNVVECDISYTKEVE